MPVVKPSSQPYSAVRNELVAKLLQELSADLVVEARGDPLIFENPIQPTTKVFVIVVWSEWDQVAWGERPGIIADAYRQFASNRTNPRIQPEQIATAVGMTWDEADYNAFFKYGIEPNPKQGEVNFEYVRSAMIEEGAVSTPFRLKLRYMNRSEAEQALVRLNAKLPNAHWSLMEIRPGSP